jgi:hypothetical protein
MSKLWLTALHRRTRSTHVHLYSSTSMSTLQIFFPTASHRRIIWSSLVNSAAQRRLTHHLHFFSHDDAPNTLGFHTFTLCSATSMSNSSDCLSHWIIIWSSSHSLNGGGYLYVPSFVLGRNHVPFLGAFSQVCKLRERLHIAAMIHTSQVCELENVSHSCIHQQLILKVAFLLSWRQFKLKYMDCSL